jgi:hypothetical protein
MADDVKAGDLLFREGQNALAGEKPDVAKARQCFMDAEAVTYFGKCSLATACVSISLWNVPFRFQCELPQARPLAGARPSEGMMRCAF